VIASESVGVAGAGGRLTTRLRNFVEFAPRRVHAFLSSGRHSISLVEPDTAKIITAENQNSGESLVFSPLLLANFHT